MLPDFPSVKSQRADVLQRHAYRVALNAEPMLQQISRRPISEGDDWSSTTVDGEPNKGGYERHQTTLEINLQEIPPLDDHAWVRLLIDRMIRPLLSQQSQMIVRSIHEITEQTGNVVHASQKTQGEALLEMIQKIEISFDQSGEPEMPTIFAGPSQADELEALQNDERLGQRIRDAVKAKFPDWRARQARRRLVD